MGKRHHTNTTPNIMANIITLFIPAILDCKDFIPNWDKIVTRKSATTPVPIIYTDTFDPFSLKDLEAPIRKRQYAEKYKISFKFIPLFI